MKTLYVYPYCPQLRFALRNVDEVEINLNGIDLPSGLCDGLGGINAAISPEIVEIARTEFNRRIDDNIANLLILSSVPLGSIRARQDP